ncbi:MAG TPA: ATP12 family protein [Acidisphaera sp.]|nr:ATP12 family protein [Acidisphaera sp.]
MKRFWNHATVGRTDAGHTILLDGRPLHLPGGAVVAVNSAALAAALAEEWQAAGGAKGGEMSFADTPLTRLAGTAQERIAPDPAPVADAIAAYGETDLLCYRADHPPELVRHQTEAWQPWLDWAALTYDAPLRMASGVMYIAQDPAALDALRRAVRTASPDMLAGLGLAVPALGSLVLGLAVAEGQLTGEAAYRLGALDELYQAEAWGEDAEAAARRARIAEDIRIAARYMGLVRQTKP